MIDNGFLVSVIMPAYNAEKNIDRALSSVINQEYTHLEIIVIDDGSIDATGEIIDKYASKDSRIIVLHVKNGGEARSRNLGLSIASGKYIAFCDADDYMHSSMIKKMVRAIDITESDIVVCGWKNVDEFGNELPWKKTKIEDGVLSSEEATKQFLTTGNIEGFCWNKMFAKYLYDKSDIKYDERRISFCDIFANFRLIENAVKITCINEPLYDYYQISSACTHTVNIKKDYDYLETLTEIVQEAEKKGLKREAQIYTTNRICKQLFGMLKNRGQYEKTKYEDYYVMAYERFLRVKFTEIVYYTFIYPIEDPMKFIVKHLFVSKEYRRCSKNMKEMTL